MFHASHKKQMEACAKLAYERHNHVVRAADTDNTLKIALTKEGFCSTHGDIQLRRRKLFGWKTIRSTCPRCDQLAELQLLNERVAIAKGLGFQGGQDSDIQKGMHVRCVGESRGPCAVSIGDVGVVKSRDEDGDYVVDFPKKDNWYGRSRDLVIDTVAEKVRPGALVTVKKTVQDPIFGWGSCKRGMHGLVVKVEHDGIVRVQFGFDPNANPSENLWNCQLKELEVVDNGGFVGAYHGTWPGKLQLGQAVHVKKSVDTPSTGWGSLKRGETGYARAYDPERQLYVCDFPSVDGWKGRPSDLEVDTRATLIRPGAQVRVREGVTPKYGWGSATRTSIGTVISSQYDGRCVVVDFPEDSTWKGTLADLESLEAFEPQDETEQLDSDNVLEALLRAAVLEALLDLDDEDPPSSWPGEIQKGTHVRCVGTSYGGGKITVGDVGVVKSRDTDGDYQVDFPKVDGWNARPRDLVIDAAAQSVRPGALVAMKDDVVNPIFGWGSYKRGMHGLVVKVEHDGVVKVQLGLDPEVSASDNLWKSQLKELEVIDNGTFQGTFRGTWPGSIQLGQSVRVRPPPSTGWGRAEPGEVGYVRAYIKESELYVCDFPSMDGWKGRKQDVKVEAVATLIRPGQQVRIREGITPKYGLDKVTHTSVGTVVSSRYDGGCVIVDFPEDSTWKGTLAELETLDHPPTTTLTSTNKGRKTCAGGHGLKALRTTEKNAKVCDFCAKESGDAGSVMYGCSICDCDACEKCFHAPEIAKATLVTPENESRAADIPFAKVEIADDTKFANGTKVVIRGLNSPRGARLNGKLAQVIKKEDDKYVVQLIDGDDQKLKKLKESHLMLPRQTDIPTHDTKIASDTKFANGAKVVIKGLNSPKGAPLNGKLAQVIKKEDDKYVIQLVEGDDKNLKKLKETNLMVPRQIFADGVVVSLHDIEHHPELDGVLGYIDGFDTVEATYMVLCQNKILEIMPSNFEVVPEAEDYD